MQSVFELKEELPFDEVLFENMKKKACALLEGAENGEYTQTVILRTVRGNEYSAVIKNALSKEKKEETELLEAMRVNNDTEISSILCMWHDGGVENPSLVFRKMLYALNSSNADSGIFVKTSAGYAVLRLENSLK